MHLRMQRVIPLRLTLNAWLCDNLFLSRWFYYPQLVLFVFQLLLSVRRTHMYHRQMCGLLVCFFMNEDHICSFAIWFCGGTRQVFSCDGTSEKDRLICFVKFAFHGYQIIIPMGYWSEPLHLSCGARSILDSSCGVVTTPPVLVFHSRELRAVSSAWFIFTFPGTGSFCGETAR